MSFVRFLLTILPRRARLYDVDHYRGLRQTNGFLDARRFFAYRNPDPTEMHVLLPGNPTFRTAVGTWAEHWIHWSGRGVVLFPCVITPILDMPCARYEVEDQYACGVVEMLQSFQATKYWPIAVSLDLVCFPYIYDTIWFAGKGVHHAAHWDGDCYTE